MTAWVEVLTRVTSPSELPVHGTIRELAEGPHKSPAGGFATSGYRPMFVKAVDGCEVWLHGNNTRVEYGSRPIFVTDGNTAWDFTPDVDRPLVGPVERVHYFGRNQFLIRPRSAAEWAGDDFTRPAGPIEDVDFAGRHCWTLELAPPDRKPYPMRIWVDIETGRILGHRIDEIGLGAQFVDLTVGQPISSDLFGWSGHTQTQAERQQDLQEQKNEILREQRVWFADTVTADPVVARIPLDFSPHEVPFRDEETGAFSASNAHTLLARNPRTRDGEWAPKWGPLHYVWSTPEWDWAAAAVDHDIDEDAVAALQEVLHPGVPVDRLRRIDPPGRGRVE